MPIDERQADTGRGRVHWLEAGAGWPVILIHGFPLSAEVWRPQLERVPEGFRFIAPDLRGFGRTPIGDGPVTMDTYARDVFALMDALEMDEATIGGLSMGGYVAFAMHRVAPTRLTALVLADTRPAADTRQAREGRAAMRTLLADKGPAAVGAQMLPKLLSPAAPAPAVAATRAIVESAPGAGVDAAIGAMLDRPDSTAQLAAVTCATLVVVGELDAITPPSDAEAMHAALRRSTLVVIPGAGHLANLEQPDLFSRALADFLSSPV